MFVIVAVKEMILKDGKVVVVDWSVDSGGMCWWSCLARAKLRELGNDATYCT